VWEPAAAMREPNRQTAVCRVCARSSTGWPFHDSQGQQPVRRTNSLSAQRAPPIEQGLAAAVDTPLADVEIALNG